MHLTELLSLGGFTLLFFVTSAYFFLYGKELEKAKKQYHLQMPEHTSFVVKTAMAISILITFFSAILLLSSTARAF